MFRKIISNLPFSPSLIEQLSWYAKKLKSEQNIRKFGLIFMILTVILQFFIFFNPPESVNASNNYQKNNEQSKILESKGLKLSIFATNITQGFENAVDVISQPNEQLSFTLIAFNPMKYEIPATISFDVSDIQEYASIVDDGGAVIKNGIISWPQTVISAESQQTRTFSIKMFEKIPTTPRGVYNTSSYDCIMSANFGTTINIQVFHPIQKYVEEMSRSLPKIGNNLSIAISSVFLLIIAFFYVRNRQLQKEIQIIRKDINSGVI